MCIRDRLEEQEHTLELTLQGMNSTAADGSVPADYQAMYDQLQEVRKRKNELTVNKGVDPNKWSQRMLREANEAQANAEAGLAPAPVSYTQLDVYKRQTRGCHPVLYRKVRKETVR